MAGLKVDGVLVLDKPSGPTSHDVVSGVRRVYGTRSVGHAGTLDPMATGVLVVLLGEACKLSSYLTLAKKSYRASVRFGQSTDTLDAEGNVDQTLDLPADWLEHQPIEQALAHERSRKQQIPPDVSAIQVGGERAHRAARRGAPPVLDPRPVSVDKLERIGVDGLDLTLELEVSKGYYVRALARDLGNALGAPAHLSALRRTASGDFRVEEAHVWPFSEPVPLLGIEDAVRRALSTAKLSELGVTRTRAGQPLSAEDFVEPPPENGVSGWLSLEGKLVALGEVREGVPRVIRGIN